MKKYDCLIIGAGHAGIEAAFILAKKKYRVALFVLDKNLVANMPCNPSIGGPAKGIVTREIDALGGMQAIAADANQLQMKMLNTSKGAGTWALRAQVDKIHYSKWFLKRIKDNQYIDLIVEEVKQLKIINNQIRGVVTVNNNFFEANYLIITTGVFLNASVHIGHKAFKKGPEIYSGSYQLANQIKALDFQTIRLKTGTPPRILKNTIDYSKLKIEPGTNAKLSFSHFNPKYLDFEKQRVCYLAYTNQKIHDIIQKNLEKSAMYSGFITGTGPRYCPSIEDKVVRFSDKPKHQIFVEPESVHLNTMYLAGLSSSLPEEVQIKIVKNIDGFENAIIDKFAYAIEYDAIKSLQLYPTLETKKINGLFFAGQVNGTSGYEEAACQGLMAGINVICKIENKPPFILKRSEAYIGVLIEDLVNKEINDPYRLLTSRAEYRLQLRNDNCCERLLKYGFELGLISNVQYNQFLKNYQNFEKTIAKLKEMTLKDLKGFVYPSKKTNTFVFEILKRPEYSYRDLESYIENKFEFDSVWKDKIDINIKFEGYIKSQQKAIDETKNIDNVFLNEIQDYNDVPNISLEAIEKLNLIKPLTLGQASRISGINLVDLINIKIYLNKLDKK
ncbi:MAG: tRNA uridine-5-carboxymethylaminomethyl(34) synthesis enzyme MnmG [Malacoplasma sp.]|nr:tRNA uridine-5-carboxymethylaminomethyl(34) synthesis enzyme MnmG [Malacoplasma sp.]